MGGSLFTQPQFLLFFFNSKIFLEYSIYNIRILLRMLCINTQKYFKNNQTNFILFPI